MAPKSAQQVLATLTASFSQDQMPLSPLEEQLEELEAAEAPFEAQAEGELVEQAASSERYSSLANRLFSDVRAAAQGSKAPNTLSGYRGYLLVNPRYH